MGSELRVWGKHKELNHTGETAFTRCDYCPHLSAIPQDKSLLHMYMYYCAKMPCEDGGLGKRMTIDELRLIGIDDCPIRRPLKTRRGVR